MQILHQNQWVSVEHWKCYKSVMNLLSKYWQVLTKGEHRAVANRKNKGRLSIVTMWSWVHCLNLWRKTTLCIYKNYIHADYNSHYLTNKLNGNKSLDNKNGVLFSNLILDNNKTENVSLDVWTCCGVALGSMCLF